MNFSPDIKLRLLKDTVIVKVLPANVSTGGIFIPATHSSINLIRAKILYRGSKFRFKNDVFFGDIVYVPEHFGTVIDLDQPDIKIYDGEDIYAFKPYIM